jgi:hypothetical protein
MIYTLSPNSGFLSILGTTMSLATTNVADVGPKSIVLIIAMTSYPTITLVKSFIANITCVVTNLIFSTAPLTSTNFKYSDSAMDLAFVASQTPACGKTVIFAINPTKTFLSLLISTSSEGIVRISGAIFGDIGIYAETLTATVDAQSITVNFSIIIEDPCKTAIFQTNPAPLLNMAASNVVSKV